VNAPASPLVKIAELARRSGVPIATIKHYLREGLIAPSRKSGRTMSWYDPTLAARVRTIKELQQQHFLPLDVIRDTLDRDAEAPDDLTAVNAIVKVLAEHGGARARSRDEVIAGGGKAKELGWLEAMGLAVPTGPDRAYRGDDLALLSTLGAARRAGISAEMLPFAMLDRYLGALRALVTIELEMFRKGVLPRAQPGDVAQLTTAATTLSERLVVLLRRKLLVPTLERLAAEEREGHDETPSSPEGRTDGQRTRRVQQRQHQRPRSRRSAR
jgi:DNA-binding transcriptional MerR regulator